MTRPDESTFFSGILSTSPGSASRGDAEALAMVNESEKLSAVF
jgi:hypothetical protein